MLFTAIKKELCMEYMVMGAFSLVLLLTIVWGVHLLYALAAGYILFFLYGLYKGCSVKELALHSLDGTRKLGNLLLLFCLIGILTGTWRASGTIAYLVVHSAMFLVPSLFICSTFLLCAFISMLTGTSFGTSATMGVICMTMGNILGLEPAYLGGAILSGSYFGDRMSPMSSSAHLVAKITQTDIFLNIKRMFRSCIGPCILTGAVYLFLGSRGTQASMPLQALELFEKSFTLSWHTVLPAALMIVLTCCRVHAKISMLVSIVSASALCVFLQGMPAEQVLRLYWFGFTSQDASLNAILGGGGLQSMITVTCIVFISSAYVGLFQLSRMFENLQARMALWARRITPFGTSLVVALFACMMTCNQTLSIFLTKILGEQQYESKEDLAHAIEDSAVVMAGLVPWNIACSVVLANVGAPLHSIFYACFLYFLPMGSFFLFKKRYGRSQDAFS